jgi:hypothetical protein
MFSFTAKRISLMRGRSPSVARLMMPGMFDGYAAEPAEEQSRALADQRLLQTPKGSPEADAAVRQSAMLL